MRRRRRPTGTLVERHEQDGSARVADGMDRRRYPEEDGNVPSAAGWGRVVGPKLEGDRRVERPPIMIVRQENRRPHRECVHTPPISRARPACAATNGAHWTGSSASTGRCSSRGADRWTRTGGAHEIADCAIRRPVRRFEDGKGERQSLFRYFQGRSSLATWLRAVLAQRYVDRLACGGGSSRWPTRRRRCATAAARSRARALPHARARRARARDHAVDDQTTSS